MSTDWNHLVAGLLEGTLTAKEREALLAMCQESEEVLEATVNMVGMDRLLAPAMTDPTGELTAREVMMRLGAGKGMGDNGWRVIDRVGQVLGREQRGRWLAWAAMILLSLVGAWWGKGLLEPVAMLARSESLVWEKGSGIHEGRVKRGDRLRALAGLLELRLSNGAKVILEGPFDVEMKGRMDMKLNVGRLAVKCPPSARGFTVETHEGKVVDLGTEFGMRASGDGTTEVHVLTGMVTMNPANRGKISLFEGDALRVERGSTSLGSADASAFITRIPAQSEREGGYVHWSFDEGAGEAGADSGRYLAMGSDAAMKLRSDVSNAFGFGIGTPPAWIDGVKGKALSFDGVGSFAESGYPGIEGALPRTVAMWIRLPEGDLSAGQGILSWGSATEYGVWQIAVDWSKHGTKGKLRIGTYGGRVVGTTDLCDGKWHHIAVVLGPGSRPEVPGNVLFYVDGNLEPISQREDFRVETNVRNAESGVILGRHSVPVPGLRNFYHGAMDEVFIFDRALVQKEIQHLMKHHEAP
ncbi:FecR domain-containing protein [Luteolibacter sp. SL250]|uniref:LamG-like jellyroll fold domain-containing protein n=1 Tax=Luteolibacter sp. SL250 TaxID=2995170 RepID=UPI00226D59D6|nr:LamG-like jellyroll fold domain-containing protein [Luteolibacter sp. SL250]WAC21827.1 FecR domain-containing protein [Luteolibacter sp. SL250]